MSMAAMRPCDGYASTRDEHGLGFRVLGFRV
jgi:hypothetical protein